MSQNDFNIANQGFPATRADINSALQALASNSAGTSEPSTTYAYQFWYDETNELLKMRNSDNDAWITIGSFDQASDTFTPAGLETDKIEEGNSSVEVVDTGTGYVAITVDGVEVSRFNSSGLVFGDNDKAIFGAGSDLQIFHDGSHSYINEVGTGSLYIQATDLRFYNAASNKQYLQANDGGEVRLYYDNGQKLATTATGIDVTGTMVSDGLDVDSLLVVDGVTGGTTPFVKAYRASVSLDRPIFQTENSSTGGITSRFDGNGDISFYEDTGTTPYMQWDASAPSIDIVEDAGTNSVDESAAGMRLGRPGYIVPRSSCGAFTTNVTHMRYYNGNGAVGSISTSGSATSYNTSSDYRLKENVTTLDNAADRLAQIPVHRFNFIADPETTVDGFLAHEVQAIVPEAVTGGKDAMRLEQYEVEPAVYDEEGNLVTEAVMGEREVPDYQGIDQSKLVPLLTAALQEALQKIDALEARVTALEG